MTRYISTEEFEKRIKPYDTNDPVDKAMYNFAHNMMLSTSTADVVERKRGKWIKSNESVLRPYMCSKCGALFDVDTVLGKLSWQYCPACGTEMEGEDDE